MKEEIIEEIKVAYCKASVKDDLDVILKLYNIKMKKKDKLVSAMRVNMEIKKAIIRMAFREPEDVFDYDVYVKN